MMSISPQTPPNSHIRANINQYTPSSPSSISSYAYSPTNSSSQSISLSSSSLNSISTQHTLTLTIKSLTITLSNAPPGSIPLILQRGGKHVTKRLTFNKDNRAHNKKITANYTQTTREFFSLHINCTLKKNTITEAIKSKIYALKVSDFQTFDIDASRFCHGGKEIELSSSGTEGSCKVVVFVQSIVKVSGGSGGSSEGGRCEKTNDIKMNSSLNSVIRSSSENGHEDENTHSDNSESSTSYSPSKLKRVERNLQTLQTTHTLLLESKTKLEDQNKISLKKCVDFNSSLLKQSLTTSANSPLEITDLLTTVFANVTTHVNALKASYDDLLRSKFESVDLDEIESDCDFDCDDDEFVEKYVAKSDGDSEKVECKSLAKANKLNQRLVDVILKQSTKVDGSSNSNEAGTNEELQDQINFLTKTLQDERLTYETEIIDAKLRVLAVERGLTTECEVKLRSLREFYEDKIEEIKEEGVKVKVEYELKISSLLSLPDDFDEDSRRSSPKRENGAHSPMGRGSVQGRARTYTTEDHNHILVLEQVKKTSEIKELKTIQFEKMEFMERQLGRLLGIIGDCERCKLKL